MTRHTYWTIAKESIGEFWEDSPFQLAAALSFYTLRSPSCWFSPVRLRARFYHSQAWSR